MSWRRCRLDWLTSEERGAVNPTEISADTVFHYSIPALDEIGDGRLEHPDEIGSGKLLLSGGEVLISKLNPRLPRVLLAEAHDVPTLASTEFIALRPGPNVDERFLRYWLGSEPLRQMLNGATMSVTRSQQRVRPEIVTKSWLRVPSIDDQRAIADYLDRETARIDALIEKKQRMKELLQERRQTLITEAISRSHDPGATARGDRVMERPTVPIRRVAQGGGLFTDGDWIESPFITDEGIRLIQTGNVGVGLYREQGFRFISEETFHVLNCTEVLPGDLLICRLAEPVGRSCIAPNLGTRMITSVDVAILRPRPGSAEVRYLNYYFSSSSHLEFIDSIARGGTRQRISRDQLGFAPVPLPPIATQRAIADYLDRETARIDALVERIDRQVALLQEHRQALITAAVTGELEIPGVAA